MTGYGKLEQFQRTKTDIQYLKDNDWTKQEVYKHIDETFEELYKELTIAYDNTIAYIEEVYK